METLKTVFIIVGGVSALLGTIDCIFRIKKYVYSKWFPYKFSYKLRTTTQKDSPTKVILCLRSLRDIPVKDCHFRILGQQKFPKFSPASPASLPLTVTIPFYSSSDSIVQHQYCNIDIIPPHYSINDHFKLIMKFYRNYTWKLQLVKNNTNDEIVLYEDFYTGLKFVEYLHAVYISDVLPEHVMSISWLKLYTGWQSSIKKWIYVKINNF